MYKRLKGQVERSVIIECLYGLNRHKLSIERKTVIHPNSIELLKQLTILKSQDRNFCFQLVLASYSSIYICSICITLTQSSLLLCGMAGLYLSF